MRHQIRLIASAAILLGLFATKVQKSPGQTATGTHKTSTTLTSTGIQGSYSLSATITAYGMPNPTGNVVFTDTTTGTTLGTVAVTATNKTGGFNNAQTLDSKYNPDGAVAADINGDGIPDLIVALANPYASAPPGAPANNNPNCGFCPGTQNIQVYLGNGDGTFQSAAYYPAGFDPNHIVVADLNGDGYPDLIVTDYDEVFGGAETSGGAYPINEGYYEMGIYINVGKSAPGTFAPAVYYKTGVNPWTAVAGDFNGDGFVDIIVDNSTDNTLELFPGNGTGTFNGTTSIVATGVSFENNHSFATADVNGDGILDLVGGNYNTGEVQVLLGMATAGKATGGFAAPMNFPASSGTLTTINPVGVSLADVNGDGKLDIVTSNRGSGNAGVLLGNGDGTFQSVVTYPIGDGGGSYANGVAIADMNGDGFPDIVVDDNGAAFDVGVLYGNGDGTFQARVGVPVGPGGGTPVIADFNQDGRPDIATENFGPNTTTALLGYATQTVQLSGIALPGTTVDNVTATFSGDATYASSTSPALILKSGGLLEPVVVAPGSATAGTAFTFTITENQRDGTVAVGYSGTLTFSSSDPLAVLPAPSTLTNGQGTFTVTLFSDGGQTISVTDAVNGLNATSSAIAVTGGGLTFTTASTGSSSVTTTYGKTISYTFTATPTLSVFNAPVNFSVAGLPSNSYTYSFSPAFIAAGTSGAQSVTLTVQVPGTSTRANVISPGFKPIAILTACLLPFLGLRRLRKTSRRLQRSLLILALCLISLGGMTGLSGCNTNNTGVTPNLTYNLTVTATAGNAATSANVTLILTQPGQ